LHWANLIGRTGIGELELGERSWYHFLVLGKMPNPLEQKTLAGFMLKLSVKCIKSNIWILVKAVLMQNISSLALILLQLFKKKGKSWLPDRK